eukprot:403375230
MMDDYRDNGSQSPIRDAYHHNYTNSGGNSGNNRQLRQGQYHGSGTNLMNMSNESSNPIIVKGKGSIYNQLRRRDVNNNNNNQNTFNGTSNGNNDESFFYKNGGPNPNRVMNMGSDESQRIYDNSFTKTSQLKSNKHLASNPGQNNSQNGNDFRAQFVQKLQLQRCNWTQTQFYVSFILIIMFDIATYVLCTHNMYEEGKYFSGIVAIFHIFTLLSDILMRLLKKKGIFLSKSILARIIILMFVLQFFTAVVSTDSLYNNHCPPNSNGCIRVNKNNQYRANNIEMRYPVTFKQSDVDGLIQSWIKASTGQEIESVQVQQTLPNIISYNQTYQFKFSQSTWYGMVIDTLITVKECTQVFKAQTVTMQSQTRLGYKDYGVNYQISEGLYSFLNEMVQEEGKKSFISCT